MEQREKGQSFQCSGNCLNCLPAQRAYCASQHAYSNMKVLDRVMDALGGLQEEMGRMQGTVRELAARIEAIQNSEASVFDPYGDAELFPRRYDGDAGEEAQDGDGA